MRRIVLSLALLALCGCDHAIQSPLTTNPPPVNEPPPNPPPPPPPPPEPPGVNYGPAGAPPNLGACASFAVLSALGVAAAGDETRITGDVGCSPDGIVTGLPEDQPMGGSEHEDDATAAQAQTGLHAAYDNLAARSCNASLGDELSGLSLAPGVHCSGGNADLNGTLTLDAQSNANAVFVIRIGGSLTCQARSQVRLVNGAQAKNVFWQVSGDVTMSRNTSFSGTLIARRSIACFQNTSVRGRLLSRDSVVGLTNCSVALP